MYTVLRRPADSIFGATPLLPSFCTALINGCHTPTELLWLAILLADTDSCRWLVAPAYSFSDGTTSTSGWLTGCIHAREASFSEFFRIFRNFLEFFGRKNQEPDSATACTDRLGPSMRERKKGYHVTAALEVCSDVDRSVLSPLFRSHTYVTMYKMSYYILEHEMNDAFSARLRRLLHLRNCS